MWLNKQPVLSVLLRTGRTGNGKVIATDEVLKAMSVGEWKPELSGWVKSWISSEENRPWPPLP